MENLLLRASTLLPPTFQIQHSFFTIGFITRTTFIRYRTESTPHLSCRTKAFPTKQELFLLQQELEEADDEEIDDDSSFLSLSVKPDRNLGLLDDYETEELGYDFAPNHKSGLFFCFFHTITVKQTCFLQWKSVTYMNLLTTLYCWIYMARSLGVML